MFCTECGSEQHESANFCTHCGAAIQDITPHQFSGASHAQSNMNASHAPTIMGNRLASDPEVDQDLMTFIDTNQDYYYRKWYLAEDKERGITFNIAAFFLTFFWLGYRRMYLYVFFLSLIFLGIDYSIYLIFNLPGVGLFINNFTSLVTGIILGLYGNQFYKKHAEKKVQTIIETTGNAPEKEQVLKSKGGRRWYGPIFALLIFLLIYIVPAILILDQQIAQEDPIETVKYTEFYDYPGVFVDDLFNTMFEKGEWVLIEDEPDYYIIAFNGLDTDSFIEQEITIQFYNEAGSDESEVLFVEIDGEELDIYDSNNFLDDLFEAHEAMP